MWDRAVALRMRENFLVDMIQGALHIAQVWGALQFPLYKSELKELIFPTGTFVILGETLEEWLMFRGCLQPVLILSHVFKSI